MGALLTFEELSTIVAQMESILNSRPLTQIYSHRNYFHVLTPAHFLIGCLHTVAVDQDVSGVKINRLNRLQYLEKITQQFWERWPDDLTSLEQRSK